MRGIQLAPLLGCVLATIAVSVGACGDATSTPVVAHCVPGASVACAGEGLCQGTQICNSDGTYAACVCADAGVVDSGLPDVAVDSGVDAGLDSGVDAGVDAAVEAAVDSGLDAGSISWGNSFAAPTGRGWGVAVDANQNVIVGASGPVSLAKLDAMGVNVWLKHFADVYAVAVDSAGAVYATGDAPGGTDFGAGPVAAAGTYLLKLDAGGAYKWLYGPFANISLRRLATRSNGNVVAVGSLNNGEDLGAGVLTPVGGPDALLVELTPAGALVRTRTYGTTGRQTMTAIAFDASGNVFLGGGYESGIDFGGGVMPGPAPGPSVNDLYVAKLDPNLGYLKQIHLGCTGTDDVTGLAVDPTGRVFFGGGLRTTMNFGGADVVSVSGVDLGLALLDASLVEVWSKRYGAAGGQELTSLAADSTGGFAIAGSSSAALTFGVSAMPSPPFVFAARFGANGTPISSFGAKVQGGQQAVQGIAYMTGSDYAITGQCAGGPLPLPSGNMSCAITNPNAFAARLQP